MGFCTSGKPGWGGLFTLTCVVGRLRVAHFYAFLFSGKQSTKNSLNHLFLNEFIALLIMVIISSF
jgi:dolichyl-phosphate-mannose--protein O-mannosyl transferase